jgi:hypothetical protein
VALNKGALESDLLRIFTEMEDSRGTSPRDRAWYAKQLSDAFNKFVLGVQMTPGSLSSPPEAYTNVSGGTAM